MSVVNLKHEDGCTTRSPQCAWGEWEATCVPHGALGIPKKKHVAHVNSDSKLLQY